MPVSELKKNPKEISQVFGEFFSYRPAILSHSKSMGWTVEYYVYNPVADAMERRRLRLNMLRKRYKTVVEFKRAANEVVCTINQKLAGGWTPFGTSENARYYTPIETVIELYLQEKSKELRPDSLRSYKSFKNIFIAWIEKEVPQCKCLLFNHTLAVRYMDNYYNTRQVEARAYNNHLKQARAFFSWCMEKCYCKENPFEHIRVKRVQEKKRTIIDADIRSRIRTYFEKENPGYLVVMELVYTSFLRPIEVSRVQINQISLSEHCIYMSADKTKNGKRRAAPLSDELCKRIEALISGKPQDWYLIGLGYKPGPHALSKKMYGKEWLKMRKALSLPDTMQLYSLRDTGFFDKMKAGIPALTVMQAADHHDLTMTTRYANHADSGMIETIRTQSPDF